MHFSFAPLEWTWVLGIVGNECSDGASQLSNAREIGPSQGFPTQDAKPDFHLVQPTGRGRRKVEMYPGIFSQPVLVAFVRAVVVQNHVQFLVRRGLGDDMSHKGQEVPTGFGGGGRTMHVSSGDLQRRKQVERAMTLARYF